MRWAMFQLNPRAFPTSSIVLLTVIPTQQSVSYIQPATSITCKAMETILKHTGLRTFCDHQYQRLSSKWLDIGKSLKLIESSHEWLNRADGSALGHINTFIWIYSPFPYSQDTNVSTQFHRFTKIKEDKILEHQVLFFNLSEQHVM